MSSIYKLVFAGPVGSGKSTAIRSLSDIDVVNTDARASDAVQLIKKSTTVAMDYGLLSLADGTRVHLYGTPGQKRFDFMWEILTGDAFGLVLMLNANDPDPVADLYEYLESFREFVAKTGLVVGITHVDASGWAVRLRVAQALMEMQLPPVVMEVDARDRTQVANLVKALIYSVDPTVSAGG